MATSTITIISGASTVTLDNTVSTVTLGTSGPQGAPGEGVPVGGTAGQILAKDSATDYDTSWIDNYTTDVRKYVKNDSGGTLAKGTVVYVSGANGANVLVKPAIATADQTSATTIGFLNETLANNGQGYAIVEGTISGIDTSAATAGDPVWLSGSVAGGVLYGVANKPQAPVHIVYLGTVTRAHANQGQIEISVNNGWELDELHNVKITSPANGQVLTYDSAQSLWVNSSETGDISAVNVTSPITGGGTSGAVTIGINQTALTIAESQVTNLVTDLAAKVPTSRTITPATGITGGGDLTANRTIGLDNTVVSYDASSSLRSLPLYNQKDAAERLLAQAVWWIDAAHSSASGQTITNLGWGGSALNATAGSTGSADSNDPKFLDWTGTNYVYVPGTQLSNMSTPNAAAVQITGDIDLRAKVAMDDWTPAAISALVTKWDAGQWSYSLSVDTNGTLLFDWSVTGSAAINKNSTVATGITDGDTKWVRATLDVDNGASGNTVTFYLSDDGVTWTQLGSPVVTAGTTSIYNGTANVHLGARSQGFGQSAAAKIYNAQILNGIGGTTVLNVDTSVITSGAATSFTALTGQTVTINRATSGRKTCVVTNPLWLFGTDDYINVADNDLLDFDLADSFTLVAIAREWATQAVNARFITKWATTGAGYWLTSGTYPASLLGISDGTNTLGSASLNWTAGTLSTFVGIRNTTADTIGVILNNTASTTSTDPTTATLANTSPLRVGTNSNAVSNTADMEGYAFAVFRRVLTTAEIALVTAYYSNRIA